MTNRNGRLGRGTLLTLSLVIAGCGGNAVMPTAGDAATDAGEDATGPLDAQVDDSSVPDSSVPDSSVPDSSLADSSPDANPPRDASGDAGSEADAVSDARSDAPADADAAPPCDDNDLCTTDSVGADGGCVNTPIVCTASDECHSAGTCDSASGACSNPAVTDGTACNDGNACTQLDTCQTGTCTGADPVVCTPSDQCHGSTCDTTNGTCSNAPLPDGTACNDGITCTRLDTCHY